MGCGCVKFSKEKFGLILRITTYKISALQLKVDGEGIALLTV